MTGSEFRQTHGDPAQWDNREYEAYFALTAQPATRDCWFCTAPNPATATRCGFCNHHTDDNPNHQPAA
ncbi:hypothetical protein [Streptomyces sp. NBRC 110035]|uniref:hypothetical protein n=1 Tax=Streptomyces sp. NBRC 110035 TaxID=1547867 RepID=UPI0005AB5EA1|nr:hypothetical protein [Streptomyces sp. NBRC 110035]